jgi:glycosyltransferase involved in cell wall biosynthesis
MKRLRILTWHTHGAYLYYLTQVPHDFYVLSKPGRPPGYVGRSGQFRWGANVHDLPVDEAPRTQLDCIVFQDDPQYLQDQYQVLTAAQRRLPRIYIEHDPPRSHPTDSRHPVDDDSALLVHVTAFNRLMWDSGRTPTRVIEHGVIAPANVEYSGGLERGIAVINNLRLRGRRLGADLYDEAAHAVPLDLVGMSAIHAGGLGEIPHADLPAFMARYRFFFNPIRYTSMGLAVIEAMMTGLPVVALATTEMATVIRDGASGYADTDIGKLIGHMRALLADRAAARALGEAARRYALERFAIGRFVADWEDALAAVTR